MTDHQIAVLAYALGWVWQARERGRSVREMALALDSLRRALPLCSVTGAAANGNDDAENDEQMAPGWR